MWITQSNYQAPSLPVRSIVIPSKLHIRKLELSSLYVWLHQFPLWYCLISSARSFLIPRYLYWIRRQDSQYSAFSDKEQQVGFNLFTIQWDVSKTEFLPEDSLSRRSLELPRWPTEGEALSLHLWPAEPLCSSYCSSLEVRLRDDNMENNREWNLKAKCSLQFSPQNSSEGSRQKLNWLLIIILVTWSEYE